VLHSGTNSFIGVPVISLYCSVYLASLDSSLRPPLFHVTQSRFI
jgi:hypothetical protein